MLLCLCVDTVIIDSQAVLRSRFIKKIIKGEKKFFALILEGKKGREKNSFDI